MKRINLATVWFCGTLFAVAIVGFSIATVAAQAQSLSAKQQLGKSIFFDQHLSIRQNQACAACHGPQAGWTGPESATNASRAVYEGSIPGRFGNRKPPSAAYATLSPIFHEEDGMFVGGNFWDGRATGELLGNPAADQALGPFLNPAEQALPDSSCVVWRVCNPVVSDDYPVSFQEVWGADACAVDWRPNMDQTCAREGAKVKLSDADRARVDMAYGNVGLSIAAYEGSAEVNAFSSKFDRTFGGGARLNRQEQKGYALFRGKALCDRCHVFKSTGGMYRAMLKESALTDFTYDNLGIPQNPENPAGVAPAFVDPGLGGFLQRIGYPAEVYLAEWGKHKVPTLRNVGKGSCEAEPANPDCIVKAYGHNGYFKSLAEIVHFYNTRDVLPICEEISDPMPGANCWPQPEVPINVNRDELGDLGLTAAEEADLVAFLMTLSDGD
jgi:cytochrome c peroxidase